MLNQNEIKTIKKAIANASNLDEIKRLMEKLSVGCDDIADTYCYDVPVWGEETIGAGVLSHDELRILSYDVEGGFVIEDRPETKDTREIKKAAEMIANTAYENSCGDYEGSIREAIAKAFADDTENEQELAMNFAMEFLAAVEGAE